MNKEAKRMEKRKIGSLDVTVCGLGCNNFGWRIDAAATAAVVNRALEAGINFFDTADIYDTGHSEEFLARALGGRRKDVVVATKFGMKMGDGKEGARPEYIRQAAEDSLRRLQTDYIDLYQLHRPDPKVPIADTLGALNDLVRAGKVREIGGSNFTAEQIREAQSAAAPGTVRFVSMQNEYSMLHREPENDVIGGVPALSHCPDSLFPVGQRTAHGEVPAVDSLCRKAVEVIPVGVPRYLRKRIWPLRITCRSSRSRRGTRCWNSRFPGCSPSRP